MNFARWRPTTARLSVATLGCAMSLAVTARALAAGTPADAAAAQGLFDESKKLLAAKQYAAACPKLEESDRLDPSPATEFYLADCYEQVGRTASAWALFLQVASASKAAGRAEREQFARSRADALAPTLSRLIVSVPAASAVPGLAVKRDGEAVGAGQLGTALPVDPGKHALSASAPGHADWNQSVDVPAGGKTITVEIPPLATAAAVLPPPPNPPPPVDAMKTTQVAPEAEAPAPRGGTQKKIGLIVGGAGIVALGVGGFFGLRTISKNNDSNSDGCNGNQCNATGYATRHDAQSAATLSTVFVGAGAALLVGGAALWFFSPRASASSGEHAGLGSVRTGFAPNGLLVNGAFE